MKTFLSAVLERLRTSYWVIPSLLAVGATLLSFVTVHADTLINAKWARATGWIWAGGPEGARAVVGHHAHRAPGLEPLDHLGQAARDAHASDQECLLDARGREETRLLLRSVWILQ